MCQAAQEQQVIPKGGGHELSAIAIVVIGGPVSVAVAAGDPASTLTISTGKIPSINAVPEASRLMLTGVIILAAVGPACQRANRSGHTIIVIPYSISITITIRLERTDSGLNH
jgi:ribose/xylose/arabinose/galactoside ABC-type transport system permease subunit